LIPENDYNVTSAYGCYLKTESVDTDGNVIVDADGNAIKVEGYDPKALYDATSALGCDGSW
jgi:hypothetical protein